MASGEFTKDSRVPLSDGNSMPIIAFGTHDSTVSDDDMVEKAVKTGLEVGFRLIDSAYGYGMEKGVGTALKEAFSKGTVTRDDVFCSTMLWATFLRPENVRKGLEKSLADLQLDYVDLLLIHHPMALQPSDEELVPLDENGEPTIDDVDLQKTWEAMEQCKDAGLVKSLGVSNFNIELLENILNMADLKHKPVCNQVECHPYLTQNELLEFCKSKDIVVMAYGTLGSPNGGFWVDQSLPVLLEDETLLDMSVKYKKTPVQLALRYCLQRGCVPVVKNFKRKHMMENLEVFNFQLSQEDMDALNNLNTNSRYWKFMWFRKHPNNFFMS